MTVGVPFSIIMISIAYLTLIKLVYPNNLGSLKDAEIVIRQQLDELGPIGPTEMRVMIIFACTMFCWIFRTYINTFLPFIKLSDAGISMLAALSLFSIPFKFKMHEFILDWKDTVKLPWGILILFGGGLCLASALSKAGVIDLIGEAVANNGLFGPLVIGVIMICVVLFMTELMSNVALVAIFAPVIAGIALGLNQEILYLVIPITMASSCAFMLPMATPPNAIVFASGYIKVHEMAKAGFILNVVSILIIVLFMKFVIPLVF